MTSESGNVVVDGIYVEYEKAMSTSSERKDSIIFVHGGCHGSWSWEKFLPFFAENGWNCYALNWYNHYKSSKIPMDRFLERSIADVTDEIGKVAKYVGGTPILIGHSMGGLAVQKFAEKNHVKALVLVTPVVPAEVGGPTIPLEVDETRPWGPPPVEISKELFFQGSEDADVSRYYSLLCPESPRAVYEATRWTVHLDKSRMTMPKLVIGAEIDKLTPHEIEKKLADFYNAEYLFVKGKGHNLLLEPGWRDTATSIARWLKSLN
ncbi:MAG: alpha/beta hydrolase [Nitrososphaerota archaeon]|nr:alpha/beta hydrolase [Nitrososphaerota archaeon]